LAWNDLFSSEKIQNAAYWKIATIELGYNFPDKWFGGLVTNVRAYVSAQNVYTFTGYSGLTPLINSASLVRQSEGTTSYGTIGVDDKRIYPLTRTFSLQLNITF